MTGWILLKQRTIWPVILPTSADGVMKKRLCKATKRSKRLAVISRHTNKAPALHSTNIWPCSSFGAPGMGIAPSTMQGNALCPKSGRCVTSGMAIGLLHNADRAVQAIEFWRNADEFFRTRVRRAWEAAPRAAPRWEIPLDEGSWPCEGGHVCPF